MTANDAAVHFAYKVISLVVVNVPLPATYAVPLDPVAVVYQLSKVKPDLARVPEFEETVYGVASPET